MGFAEETKAMQEKKTAVYDVGKTFDVNNEPTELPVGTKPADKVEATPEPKEEAKPEAKVKIGNKEFASMEEAIKYAEDIEKTSMYQEGYINALKEKAPEEIKPEVDEEDAILTALGDKIFEDPKAAIRQILEHATKKAVTKIDAAQSAKEKERDFWNSFYEENPDLAETKDVVKWHLENNWDNLSTISIDKAKKELAEKSRAFINRIVETKKPKEDLTGRKATIVGASNGHIPVTEKKEETIVDFIGQINKLRKKAK